MLSKIRLLYVDDEKGYQASFRRTMRTEKALLIETASDGVDALAKLEIFPADILITDVKMPKMDGLALLEEVRIRYPDVFVVIVTGYGTIEDAVNAMKAGAYDYILKPFDFDAIRMVIEKIIAHERILKKGMSFAKDRRNSHRFENFIGQDPSMFQVFQQIVDVAPSNATVLLTGETGTGKELAAEAIHFESLRRDGPMIRVNCAAFTETLINSELFGHEKGAFTGATAQTKGQFEFANGGTIFLDEIGDIPLTTQISLLRVLESKTFQRVGGTRAIKVDIRVVCATNKDLSEKIKEHLFRADLFYRVAVVSIHIPPLRERKSDIPLLASYFTEKYHTETKTKITGISGAAMRMLTEYNWPGNVRELANVIERAVIFCKGREIIPANLREDIKKASQEKVFDLRLSSRSLLLGESTLIRRVLEEKNWNLKQTANELEIARGTLYSKMKKYGIEKPQ